MKKVWKFVQGIFIFASSFTNKLKAMTTQVTIEQLKKAITNQDELNLITKEVWFMNFTRLIKLGFSLDFATKKATEISEKQMALLNN